MPAGPSPDAEILDERARVERSIEGVTLCTRLAAVAQRHPDRPAYSDRRGGDAGWRTLTWAETRRLVLEAAAGFAALGLRPGETVALMMPNRSEHVLADLGAVHAGGVPTTVYATLAADQIAFVAGDCAAAFAVLDGAEQLERWRPALDRLPALRKVIVVDPASCPSEASYMTWDDLLALGRERLADEEAAAEIDHRWRSVQPDDTLTVLYTSGTTGDPKGVVITHAMALYEAAVSEETSGLPDHNVGVSYLPFAHIADRVLSIYLPICRAAHIHFCPDTARLAEVLREVRPNSFFGVPRVWEKIMAGIQAVLGTEADEAKKAAVEGAMETGRRYVASLEHGRSTPPELAAAFAEADRAVLSTMRGLLGIDRVAHALSAAAPLPIEVARFFAGLGIKILDVYGMTETTGAVTANTNASFRLGTVGRPFPGVQLRLAEAGEIIVRSATGTPGYLNRPAATAELLDGDGWINTGDVGEANARLSRVQQVKRWRLLPAEWTAESEELTPTLKLKRRIVHGKYGEVIDALYAGQ